MSGKKLMEAIGGLDDRYILEFAQPEPMGRSRVHWLLPVAASLCLLAGGLSLYFMDGEKSSVSLEQPSTNSTLSTALPTASVSSTLPGAVDVEALSIVIWAEGEDMLLGPGNYLEEAAYPIGVVTLQPMLQNAMEQYSDPNVRYAVGLWDAAGAEEAVVYEQVTQALGLDWNGESDVLFLTRAQIGAIQCPEGMALCVELVRETDGSFDPE